MYLDRPHGGDHKDDGAGLVPQLDMMIRALFASPIATPCSY